MFRLPIVLLAAAAAFAQGPQIPPTGPAIQLFNGRDLSGFDVFLKSKGLNNDPDKVFTVRDGVVRASGSEFGYIVTKQEYGDYYLRAEFKWGEATHEPRYNKARDSGILYHVSGPDMVWPKSIEFQWIEGGTGDILVVGGTGMVVRGVTKTAGRFDRFGKGAWKDEIGYRDPANELEKPHGEWNTVEMIADGDTVRYWVNGKLANEGTGATVTRGKILFQSEGAEVFYRNLELRPLLHSSKKKISRAADVPNFQYAVRGKVEDLVKSDAAFAAFAADVRKNVDSVLRDYTIDDAGTRRGLLGTLAALDVLDGRDQDALGKLDLVRVMEEKPSAKLMSGLVNRAILEARRQTRDRQSPQYRQAFHAALKRSLEAMPFEVVQNDVKSAKAGAQIGTADLLVGQLRAEFDPVVEKTGGLSSNLAHILPMMRLQLVERLPLRDILVEAYSAYLSAHTREKPDVWAPRDVQLDAGKGYRPVMVGVWDSGVDFGIFKEQLARSGGEPALLAYDVYSKKTSGNLFPLTAEQLKSYPASKSLAKGLSDLQANIDSPEASEVRQRISTLKPDQVRPFIEELSLFGIYAHGTHVAGILVAGNPYAKVVTGRITFDYKMMPDPCPTQELVERGAEAMKDYVRFFQSTGTRVVNMSWGGSVKDYESALEKCAIGKTPEERKQTARQWFEIEKSSLQQAMAGAPGILFVAAAGNSNSDSSFNEAIPASLKLPNLLVVGAVDKAGDEAGFTSYGPTVVVHANGYEVESYIPGGDRQKMSGTSMASPNAANLAAKILTVNPKLTPVQVIDLIRQTAEKTADGRRNLIHPKKALAAATAW